MEKNFLVNKFSSVLCCFHFHQPKRRLKPKQSECWTKLEKFAGENIPECVKFLLENAGYNRLLSLSVIDDSQLTEIESHLQSTRDMWVNELQCCNSNYYMQNPVFRFLPGHRTMILGFRGQIEQISCVKNDGSRAIRIPQPDESSIEDRSEAVKQHLVGNLMKFMAKHGFALTDGIISSCNIQDFESGCASDDFAYKCRFKCSFCKRVFPLKFVSFWQTSNITKHLKSHILEESSE